ncbi:hypothetical protein V6N12_009273 [Hibiscus sabdariffa]|uniref:Uncharacterized protein n=1 Tax=Hibiscus sabdariffa TaxID=183260 RepID=A0ABR2BKB8_9ROSI
MDFAHGTVTSLSGQASSGRQSLKQWHNSDIGEFTLRDASSAASMHLKQPISKSEEARRLLFRADLTVHKVVVSPMIADTIKESSEYLVFVFGNMLGGVGRVRAKYESINRQFEKYLVFRTHAKR